MPWYLTIKTASDERRIKFETREDAKQALVRARSEIFEQASGRGGTATIEDRSSSRAGTCGRSWSTTRGLRHRTPFFPRPSALPYPGWLEIVFP